MQRLSRAAFALAPLGGLRRHGGGVGRRRFAARACAARPAGARGAADLVWAGGGAGGGGVRVVCCDLDGTLLDSRSGLPAANAAAVARVVRESGALFVPATGKSRAGALRALGPAVGGLLQARHPGGVPGVFLQGLQVFGAGGAAVHEGAVAPPLAAAVAALADELRLSLIAYAGDAVLCAREDAFTALLPAYHEPAPVRVASWTAAAREQTLNKFIFMADPPRIDAVRPRVAAALAGRAELTQAQGNMLEVLPPGASKGDGVRRLLKSLGVPPASAMAIGDAENDLEMLGLVGVSCAVQNALPSVKAAARFTDLPSNDDGGVAAALERFVLGPRAQAA